MDEAGDLFARLHAEQRIGALVDRQTIPSASWRHSHGALAARMMLRHTAPADMSCSHSGILKCGPALLTTRDDDGRSGEARAFDLDHFLREIGLCLQRELQELFAQPHALFAAIDDEAPGRELAVIGNARCKAQDFLDFRPCRVPARTSGTQGWSGATAR